MSEKSLIQKAAADFAAATLAPVSSFQKRRLNIQKMQLRKWLQKDF